MWINVRKYEFLRMIVVGVWVEKKINEILYIRLLVFGWVVFGICRGFVNEKLR